MRSQLQKKTKNNSHLVQHGRCQELLIFLWVEERQRIRLAPGHAGEVQGAGKVDDVFAYSLNELFKLRVCDSRRNRADNWQACKKARGKYSLSCE